MGLHHIVAKLSQVLAEVVPFLLVIPGVHAHTLKVADDVLHQRGSVDESQGAVAERKPGRQFHFARIVGVHRDVADALARQRQLVLTRLRRMGVDVIEAPYDKLGFAGIDRYLALRAQEAIAG